jgi:hypothetical protein
MSIQKTFEELRELLKDSYWNDCICVCRGLMKDNPCECNCPEFLNEDLTNSHKEKNETANTKNQLP